MLFELIFTRDDFPGCSLYIMRYPEETAPYMAFQDAESDLPSSSFFRFMLNVPDFLNESGDIVSNYHTLKK